MLVAPGYAALLGGAVGQDFGSQGFGFGLNARAASKSWDRQKNWATRGPTYAMQGLRDAGINPIIAAGSGIHSGASRAPQAAPSSSHGRGAANLMLNKQLNLLDAQIATQGAIKGRETNQAKSYALDADLKAADLVQRRVEADFYSTPFGKMLKQLEMGTTSAHRTGTAFNMHGKTGTLAAAAAAGGTELIRWLSDAENRKWLKQQGEGYWQSAKDWYEEMTR